jgi:hypothetical protein
LFQIAQQIYFFVAFGYDVIEPRSNIVTRQVRKALRVFKAVFFTSVVVPTAVVSLLTSGSQSATTSFSTSHET